MRSIVAVLMLLWLAPVLAEPTVTRQTVAGQEWVVLDNGLVRLAVNPTDRARIESFRYLPGGVDLLKRNLVTEQREPLLPVRSIEAPGGAEDHFWGMVVQWKVNDTRLVRAEVMDGVAVAETEGEHNGVTVRRRVALPAGSVAAEVHVALINRTDKAVVHSYWFHALPEVSRRGWAEAADWRIPDESELTVVPAADQPGNLGRGQPLWPGRGTVVVDASAYNTFFAPAQPWMAKWDPALRCSLVVGFRMADMLPDGALFANRLRDGWPERNTLEVVTGTRTLKPQETQEYQLRLIALPESGPPLAVSLSWALSRAETGCRLHALRARPAATAEVLTTAGEVVARVSIPAMAAAAHHDLRLPEGVTPAAVRLSTPEGKEVLSLSL